MPDTQTRELHLRAEIDAEARIVRGVGVPWDETITVWGARERLERGAVEADGALLFYRHTDPIGVVIEQEDTDAGWHPTARFSKTARADEALELARDGALPGMSIGFEPLQWRIERDDDGQDVTVYERVRVREVSLVPFPAYPSATVTEVRHQTEQEPAMPSATAPEVHSDDLAEIREGLQDVQRAVQMLGDRTTDATPVTDERSAGEWLRDLARGDEDTVRAYEGLVERAYAGGTSADGILTPQYVGDTIRLIEAPNVLGQIFATGQLPAKGLKLEYGVLESDNIDVKEQVTEGDNLTTGKLTVDVQHADIKTYGGYLDFTRQKIERTTNVNILDTSLRRLAMKAGARKAAVLRETFAGVVATNKTMPGRTVVVSDNTKWAKWVEGIVDAAEIYQDLGLTLDALLVDKSIFKTLATITATDGRPLMTVRGTGVNTVGEISAKTLGGDLAGVSVVVNLKQATPGAAFVNGEAIRQYNGAVAELADENIINLTKQFGLYYYAANAVEIPEAILPVVAAPVVAAPVEG